MVAISNPNIPLQARTPSIVGAFQRGQENSRRNKLLDLAIQSQEQQISQRSEQFDIDKELKGREEGLREAAEIAIQVRPHLDNLESIPLAIQQLERIGSESALQLADMIRSGNVAQAKAATDGAIAVAESRGLMRGKATQASAKAGTIIPSIGPNGQQGVFVTTTLPDGTVKSEFIPAPKGTTFISRLGETPQQQSQREIQTAQGKAEATQAEQRASALIQEGQQVADGIPTLKRTLELLRSVETGGVLNQAQLRFAQTFGIETAEQGELSALLGKAVLAQLRTTFGAQFTEREGARLEQIEAGFGRNNQTNMRLLNNAIEIFERKAQRAIRMLEQRGRFEEADEIQNMLDSTLGEGQAQPQGQQVGRFQVEVIG